VVVASDPGSPFIDTGDGIQITDNTSFNVIEVNGAKITSSGAQGVLVNNSAGGAIYLDNITIDKASNAGALVSNSSATVEFSNLNIALTDPNAIGIQANNSGAINSALTNSVSTAATTQPALQFTDTGPLNLFFNTVSSGVTAGTNSAMEFVGTTNGAVTVSSAFTVSGTPGTEAADVDNSAGILLTLPPP
jgi:hypothetical protein